MKVSTYNKLESFSKNVDKRGFHPLDNKRWNEFVWEVYNDDCFDIQSDIGDFETYLFEHNFSMNFAERLCSLLESSVLLLNFLYKENKIKIT